MGERRIVNIAGVLAALTLAVAACSGDDGDSATSEPTQGPIVTESSQFDDEVFIAETTVVPVSSSSCPVEVVEIADDWPFGLPDGFVPSGFEVDDLRYVTVGVTGDAERVLVGAFDEAFGDYEALEPTGGSADIAVEFESIRGTAQVVMTDEDGDDCWDVSISASYLQPPDARVVDERAVDDQTASGDPGSAESADDSVGNDEGSAAASGDDDASQDPDEAAAEEQAAAEAAGQTPSPTTAPPTTVDPTASEEFDNVVAVGRGEIVTRRGTFPLRVTSCALDDQTSIVVEAFAVEGSVVIESFGPEALSVVWTYADGVVIADEDAKVLAASVSALFVVGDGVGPDGEESVIVDLQCDL